MADRTTKFRVLNIQVWFQSQFKSAVKSFLKVRWVLIFGELCFIVEVNGGAANTAMNWFLISRDAYQQQNQQDYDDANHKSLFFQPRSTGRGFLFQAPCLKVLL
ncbi:hypothetical protein KRX11_09535 [Pasteurellaceae bacterium TAE3-ERU1]|nr:hypothetical protein [Pasteurellaceae bacterium TAE3-ERU1]